jgi:Na+/H+ antiporter NhaA
MAAIARVLSRASGTQADIEMLKAIAIFCGIGLTVSLFLATNGLDMSAGFF